MSTQLTERLANCLAALRAGRGWTLDQLAAQSGVSRAALSRLENAEVSPSADVLSRLACAYGLTPSRLLGMVEDGFAAHVPRDDQAILRDGTAGHMRRCVSPSSRALAGEVLECRLSPGSVWQQDAPAIPGQEHHLIMLAGGMSARIEAREFTLSQGDALRFRPHGAIRFETDAGQGAKYILCMVSPAS
ncbi:XRE family transcriptional regulator [Tropicibacter oceani]|uniref:XRE family transcriptional regulator n=1 Tax=Tropicibacter oceani TaxID=3058420 RepID=A0ABY8QFC5_9RHOB|nr:XRE family transcriptional regulator [Tropicibacter oceani]WGW03314.1 XRE family transcriptional regulator [Tropicibacter oceani]